MLNTNQTRTVSDYERVENTLAELTPDPQDFEGRTYPAEDVKSDIKQLDDFRHTPEYKKGEERSDAKLLEKTFTDMVERGDWFSEEEAYGFPEKLRESMRERNMSNDNLFELMKNKIRVLGIVEGIV